MESARLQPKSTSGADATMINETLEHARETLVEALRSPDKIQTVTSSTFYPARSRGGGTNRG
jgi:hypothetical protein